MRIPEGPGSGRPAAPAQRPAAKAPEQTKQTNTATADSYQVVPRSPWQTQGHVFPCRWPPEDGPPVSDTPPAPVPTNPKLAEFLGHHEEMKTNQDFINYWLDQGGWGALERGCQELDLSTKDVTNYRSAAIIDLAYPPPPPDGSLPMSAAEADKFHIVQYANPTYNPTGPSASKNCGPASLAMVLDTQGKIPAGLTPEQKVDYARALMFPKSGAIEYVEIGGQQIAQLDQDHATTGNVDIEAGAEQAGLPADIESGWDALDQALRDGKPIVAFGDCYEAWKQEFPDRTLYGGGEIGHFIAILGRTGDGQYVVDDPMYRGGSVEMTREQLAVFFDKDGDNTPGFVAVEGAGKTPAAPPPPTDDVPVRRGRHWVV
jgi:hypothetical protein